MRKRSSYRPRPILLDTMGYVKEGMTPLPQKPEDDFRIRMRMASAFEAVKTGKGEPHDLNVLAGLSNMATALARKHGADWRPEIRLAADSIEAMMKRASRWKRVQATPAELEHITLLTRIHDAQLDKTTVADMEQAILVARKGVQRSVAA